MTAGVQSFDPGAAYLPASPSNPSSPSKAGGKGAGADPGAEASDFRNEMDLQDAAPQRKSTGRPEKDSAKTDQGAAGNAAKKQNARPARASVHAKDKGKDDAAPAPVAATPAEAVEPQRPILPITFAPIQPDQAADEAAETNTSPGEATQEAVSQDTAPKYIVLQQTVSQNVIVAKESLRPSPRLTLQNELIPAKTGESVPPQKPAAISESPVGDASLKAPDDVPERDAAPESEDPQPDPKDSRPTTAPVTVIRDVTNPIVATPVSANPIAPSQPQTSEIQPVSQAELKVPELTPLEPAAAGATQQVEDAPPPSSPSALAFAARLTAVEPHETDSTIPKNPTRPAPAYDASVVVTRIPVRYAPTAQIIPQITPQITPRAGQKSVGDLESRVEPTKYTGPEIDRSARPDFVVPGSPATNDTAKSAQGQPAPEPLPTPRTERVIEPPSAPPTSSRDIRVQVPDNNGGSTQVRFLETGGEVRVSVRTADTGLAQSLRSHLNDLSLRLAEGGVPAEIWKPAASSAASQNDQHQPDREGRGSEGRQSGSNSGGHSGSQGDPQDQQDRPAWLEEMEASLMARK